MVALKRPALRERHYRLLEMVKVRWVKLGLAVLCMLAMAGTEAAIPFLMKPAIDDIFVKQDMTMLSVIPIAVILIYIVNKKTDNLTIS